MTDLVFLPAYQLAQLIRDRQISAVELLDAYLRQITNRTYAKVIVRDGFLSC